MAETSQGRRSVPVDEYADHSGPPASGWAGWVVFAGVMLIMVACFQVVQGLVALFDDGFYAVRSNGLVINVNYNTWGWIHLHHRCDRGSSPGWACSPATCSPGGSG